MPKLYTLGYGNLKNPQVLLLAADELDAVIVDIRQSAGSRNPRWRKAHLEGVLRDRYHHLPAFGNKNYRGGPIELSDPAAGVEFVEAILESGLSVVLMCACWNYHSCHRRTVAGVMHRAGHASEELTKQRLAEFSPQMGLFPE